MLRKLVSNLPYNPSMLKQLGAYAQKLEKESALRKWALVFICFTLAVQLVSFIRSARPSVTGSPNDIVYGGFDSKEQAVQACQNNTQDFKTILSHFKISCDRLDAPATALSILDTNNNLQKAYILGRREQGPFIKITGKQTDERHLFINDVSFYIQRLTAWDFGRPTTYKALSTTNSDGVPVQILLTNGGVVMSKEHFEPLLSTHTCPGSLSSDLVSCPTFSKKVENLSQSGVNTGEALAKAGDTIRYTLSVTNTSDVPLDKFVIKEDVSDVLEYADIVDSRAKETGSGGLIWDPMTIDPDQTVIRQFNVKVKNPLPNTPASFSNPSSFDLIMSNVYMGQPTHVALPASSIKKVEFLTVITLPRIDTRFSLSTLALLVLLAWYFFFRGRVVSKELQALKKDYRGDI